MSKPRPVTLSVDGEQVQAPAGSTLAAALMLHASRPAWRRTRFDDRPRGLFCGIGICFDCLVSVDGGPPLRACLLPAGEGMHVQTVPAHHEAGSAARDGGPAAGGCTDDPDRAGER